MAQERETEPELPDREPGAGDDGWSSVVLVPVWIGLFMGSWWGVEQLLVRAPDALGAFPALRGGARALAGAREVIAPILGLLFGSYVVVLFGVVGRRLRGEPSPCQAPDRASARPRSGVPKGLRHTSAIAQVERELDRARRAERSGFRRAALSVNDRLMLGALCRRGYNDNIGCAGIVLILVAATMALPFTAAGVERVVGFELDGRLGALLWFALAYAGFCIRWVWVWWKKTRDDAVAPSEMSR